MSKYDATDYYDRKADEAREHAKAIDTLAVERRHMAKAIALLINAGHCASGGVLEARNREISAQIAYHHDLLRRAQYVGD